MCYNEITKTNQYSHKGECLCIQIISFICRSVNNKAATQTNDFTRFHLIEKVLDDFRNLFHRKATYQWFVILVIGFMVRYDHLGVTSVIRALSLDGNCYETMLHFFRSKAYQLSAIRQRWCEVVRGSGLLYQVDGKTVLIGDGVKQSKEAYHMQKTFRQDFINRKAIKNTGQLPMYLIENHHEGIVSREKYDAVQAEMARRNAAKSPSKNAVTGMASYASKYALSERLVCGECGTLYRRCTWTRNGEKRVVWRCVSRLDYGKKYCHNSPTLDEAPLQQAILAALNKAMADKNSLIRQITDAMETEIIPFPGGTMSLGDIERRLRELEQQFQTLLEKAADDPAAYGGQFKEILDEQTLLKERRSGILADNNEQAKANQRIMDAAQTLENASPYITEWDESAVRQLVETAKVLSKDEIAVTLKGGIEIRQKIVY